MSDPLNKPMMSDHEIMVIDQLIEEYKPVNVLEWGSGGSTVYFPKQHKGIKKWISIEHSGKYIDKVKDCGLAESVTLVHCTLEVYLSIAKKMMPPEKYDFILIDGLMRAECLMYAEDLLSEKGFILVHDTGAARFKDISKWWPHQNEHILDGEKQYTEIAFAHRGLKLFKL